VFGLRTSAIRYYEQIGILPPPMRKNGQRRYDNSALFRLAVVQRARETDSPWRKYASCFSGFAWYASTETLAQTLATKDRGTPGSNEAAQANGDIAQARGELSLRRTRRVRRENSSVQDPVRSPTECGQLC